MGLSYTLPSSFTVSLGMREPSLVFFKMRGDECEECEKEERKKRAAEKK